MHDHHQKSHHDQESTTFVKANHHQHEHVVIKIVILPTTKEIEPNRSGLCDAQ
jgi:hypothetical protein